MTALKKMIKHHLIHAGVQCRFASWNMFGNCLHENHNTAYFDNFQNSV